MKMVQSFWSHNVKDIMLTASGWLSPEYMLMSWALSCLQLRKYYDEVILYTDSIGAEMLIDKLSLPYTKIVCDLDRLNSFHSQLWALPKVYAYSQQSDPFLHVDGDVFIWKRFSDELLEGDLIAQNFEFGTGPSEANMRSLESNLSYLPPEMIAEREASSTIYAYNAGILGGHDVTFYHNYASKAMEFLERNKEKLSHINVSKFNTCYEQFLYYCLVKKENRKVKVLFKEIIGEDKYKGLGDFNEVPHNKQYLHLLGKYKVVKEVCYQLADRLRCDYPEYYYRIIKLFRDRDLRLIRDTYWFQRSGLTEDDYVSRYFKLKSEFQKNNVINKDSLHNVDRSRIEATRFRSAIVRKEIQRIVGQKSDNGIQANSNQIFSDIEAFETTLLSILETKFAKIAEEYLYARDINCVGYFQLLFGNRQEIYEKILIAEESIEIIESKFDWVSIYGGDHSVPGKATEMLIPSAFYTAVVPECDQLGYSLASLDELDYLLLDTVRQKPISVIGMCDQIKSAFDPVDLQNSFPEFERLIFGRIKKALMNKTIHVGL